MSSRWRATWAYNVALLAVVYDRTGSLGWVAAATLGRFVPSLLFSPYAGVLADRFERVRVMVGLRTWSPAASQAALAVSVLADGARAPDHLLAGVTAVASAPVRAGGGGGRPQIVDEEDLAAANSLRGVIENIVQVAGAGRRRAHALAVLPAWSVFASTRRPTSPPRR